MVQASRKLRGLEILCYFALADAAAPAYCSTYIQAASCAPGVSVASRGG
jgi:hypothetical protein